MFDFISAGDLIVLGIAAAVTVVVIAVTQWWQNRKGHGDDPTSDES